MTEKISVRFKYFWPSFDEKQNLFYKILTDILKFEVEIVNDEKFANLEIRSVFLYKNQTKQALELFTSKFSENGKWNYYLKSKYRVDLTRPKNAEKVIWYTGEPFHGSIENVDAMVGFSKTDEDNNVLYFPHWMLRLNWDSKITVAYHQPEVNILTQGRSIPPKPYNCCIFSGNPEPERSRIVAQVKKVMPVNEYGNYYRNRAMNKIETSKEFGFQICPENTLMPGYVTEKPIEAWSAGNIPIWQGLDRDGWLNPKAIIDVTNLTSTEIPDYIKSLDDNELTSMRNEAILSKEPTLVPLVKLISVVLGVTWR